MTLHIYTKIVTDFQQNARVLIDDHSKKAIIIDPGGDVESLYELANTKENQVESIVLTHCHIDHAGGVKALMTLFEQKHIKKPALYYHHNEQPLADRIEAQAMMFGVAGASYKSPPPADENLAEMKSVSVGKYRFECKFTPGHSPGHISLYGEHEDIQSHGAFAQEIKGVPVVIAGDALFYESIGRTDLPLANHDQLIKSIKNELFALPDQTIVMPGHGPNTTIGHEKQYNMFCR